HRPPRRIQKLRRRVALLAGITASAIPDIDRAGPRTYARGMTTSGPNATVDACRVRSIDRGGILPAGRSRRAARWRVIVAEPQGSAQSLRARRSRGLLDRQPGRPRAGDLSRAGRRSRGAARLAVRVEDRERARRVRVDARATRRVARRPVIAALSDRVALRGRPAPVAVADDARR